jgi:hypothetical protein
MKFGLTFVGALLFAVSTSHGHEAIFSWTYTTDLTPKGHGEFEQWITTRWEKEHGSYSVVDFREEFEYGVTDNFQLAIYLNHHYVHANDDVPAEDPARPGNRLPGAYETGGEDVHAGHNPATPFDSYHFESVSLEGIYRLLSPYKDPIGLALYFEPSVGDQETELEWKILLQKNWLEDRLVWALNVNYELEFEKEDGGATSATACSNGSPDSLTASCAIGQQVWNFGTITNLPMLPCTSIPPTLSGQQFIMVVSAGGPPSDSFVNSPSGRHSVKTTRNLPRTTGTFLAMSTKNITCGGEWDLISRR